MALASLLAELEAALREASLWEVVPPPPAALDSVEPFCIDTLSLPQWLQWMFLPRMRALLDARTALPARCGVAAIAEVYFMGREDGAATRIIRVLSELDRAIADPPLEGGTPG
jgi:uncharacterized protein YqcC (DUF446 family)